MHRTAAYSLVILILTLVLHVARSAEVVARSAPVTSQLNSSNGSFPLGGPEPLVIGKNLTIEQISKMLLLNYDSNHRPGFSDSPTLVEINIYVQSFGSISVIDMDYSIDILLRQKWRDPRLQFRGYNRTLSLSYLKEKIWIPDLFFRNSKYGFLHQITTPNYLIWLESDGTITFSQKLTIRLACPMQLWNFPMDTQICPLEIGSYGFALSDLEFAWMRGRSPVVLNQQMVLNEFEIPDVRSGSCHRVYSTTGQFTCLYVEFQLERKFGFYLIYTYLPSVLIVAISWISFWIDYKAVPARITLGLLSVLSLMTQSAATVQKLPRVSYIKAIDVWLFACLAFVVASLLEFALVNMIARRREQRRLRDELRNMMGREMKMLGGNLLPGFGIAGGVSGGGGGGIRRRQPQTPSTPARLDDAGNEAGNAVEECDEASEHAAKQPSAASSEPPSRQPVSSAPGGRLDSAGVGVGGGSEEFKPECIDNVFVFLYPACFLAFNLIYWFTYMFYKHKT